jgi:transcriptional activator SPT8
LAHTESHASDFAQGTQSQLDLTQDTTLPSSTNASGSGTLTNDTSLPESFQTKHENTENPPPTADSDAKSDASFDPLFDGDDADDNNLMEAEPPKPESIPFESRIAMPGQQNFTQPVPATVPRPTTAVAPPKNAPPLLDPLNYATFSLDLLLTASIDGQVILWDRRTHTPGKGVGRLWLNEKTPPWCLSVTFLSLIKV